VSVVVPVVVVAVPVSVVVVATDEEDCDCLGEMAAAATALAAGFVTVGGFSFFLADTDVEKNENKLPCFQFFFCLVAEDDMLLVMLVINNFDQYKMKRSVQNEMNKRRY
jgi:hypothetical protein